jgi:NADPH:quinone reductase-like Zn-dependent oxidoreductase/malonyl CoA-acyl carrier protein transacylase
MAPESDVLPAQNGTSTDEDAFLFVLCANDEQALARTREQLVEFLESDEAAKVDMRDLAYTLGQRRSQLSWRSALVATELDDLSINTASPRVLQRRVVRPPKIAFAFTGQGAQSFAMGRELLQYPTFAESLRQSSSCVESFGATFSLQEELYASETTSRINDADVSQAASTAIQIALVDLLRSWGVEPAAVVGHSSGEVAAAYAAGILSLPGAMRIAYARGQMAIRIKTVQPDFKGGMMAVSAGMEDVAPLLDIVTSGTVVVACENSPKSLTVSGEDVALDELETLLEEDGVPHRRLAVDFPYHSPFLEPFVDQYEEDICTTDTFSSATNNHVEFFSAMAGRKIDSGAVKKPSYWASSAKFRVRFTSAMNALLKSKTPPDAVVEIGPNPTLTWATKSILKALGKLAPAAMETLPSLQRGENARVAMLKLAGSLFGLGQRLDLNEVNFGHLKDHGFRPRLVDGLKPYPWTRSRYWIESKVRDDGLLRQFSRHDLLGHAKTHSKDSEMAWSNNFEVEDMPWLRGHQIGSSITFPLAGYICAALEASKQRAMASSGSDDVITGFTVRDVRMQHNLVFQEGVRVELAIKLRPLNGSDFDEFELSTWSEEQRTWVCHCRALVRCHLAEDAPETGALAKWGEARGKCHSRVGSPLLYQGSAKAGPRRTGAFRNVYNLWYGSGKTTAEVVVSDTEAGMPHHYETASIIHPTTLDGLLQCGSYIPFLDPSNAPIGSTSNIWVPNAVEEVIIGSDVLCKPGLVLQTVARSEKPPQKLRGTYAIDATLENSSNPRVQIRGLRLGVEESLPLQWPEPHYGCYKVEWQPATPLPADATKWHILQGPGDDSGMAGILSHKFGTSAVSISQSLPAEAKFCIVLDVGDGLLGSVDEASFDNIKQALTTCEAVVWVTRGAFHHAKSPTAGMAVGLLRTIRSEMQAPVATLDLDPFTANDVTAQAALVGRIAGHIATTAKKADPNMEMEFTESSGQLFCSRIVHDEELDCNTHAATDVAPPQDEAFNPDTRGVFGLQRPGLADSLYFQRVDSVPQMADDEVEIQVAATGIGAEDIEALQGRECSGTVVRCSEKVTRVNVGDKVFGLANLYGAFGTFACARETSLAPLPAAISLEKAASIPATFGVAQLALIEVGRVREGERIVVLAAGSAVGQAAVQVGKAAGAYVYAVVDSSSDREAILAVRPQPDHIVGSLNEVPSVEVVLNPVPGTKNDHARVSRVLAPLGRFVQIGDLASDSAHRLHTGCSVSGAPLSAVADSLPSQMGIVLDAVADLLAGDLCSGVSSIQMVPLDHLSETLLTVSPRDPWRKVLVPTKGEIIKVI